MAELAVRDLLDEEIAKLLTIAERSRIASNTLRTGTVLIVQPADPTSLDGA